MMLVALVAAACSAKPVDVVEPTPIGVIESIESEGDLMTMTMIDGSEFSLDLDRDRAAYGGGPDKGDLFFIVEETPEGLRYFAIDTPRSTPECPFVVSMGDAWEESTAIVFQETAFRLPKADSFERPPWQSSDYYAEAPTFCLNEQGAVLGQRSHLQLP